MELKHVFVVNPSAGSGTAQQQLQQALARCGRTFAHEIYLTAGPADATRFVRAFSEAHSEPVRFYACGGDGTLSEVAGGAVGFSQASVACLPYGSGNDFVKYYGGSKGFLDLGAQLDGTVHRIDLIRVGGHYGINVCHFGFDTCVAETMNRVKTKPLIGGKNAYTTGVAAALIGAMRSDCTLTVDGEQLGDGRMLLCSVANGHYVGGRFRCAPFAVDDDGLLEVCMVKPVSRLTFLKLVGAYTEGRHLTDERFKDLILYRRGRRIEVDAPRAFGYSLDGEVFKEAHFVVEAMPQALDFVVPAGLEIRSAHPAASARA